MLDICMSVWKKEVQTECWIYACQCERKEFRRNAGYINVSVKERSSDGILDICMSVWKKGVQTECWIYACQCERKKFRRNAGYMNERKEFRWNARYMHVSVKEWSSDGMLDIFMSVWKKGIQTECWIYILYIHRLDFWKAFDFRDYTLCTLLNSYIFLKSW